MPPQIETPRLILRAPGEGDTETLVRELNNFNISRNTARIPFPYNFDDAKEFLHDANALAPPSGVWAIAKKPNAGALVGVVSLHYDPDNCAELGYWLAESIWAQGFGSEAALAIVDHAFANPQLNKLVACFHDDNPISGRILARLGFQTVGACTSFSRAQNREIAVTNLHLTRAHWDAKMAATCDCHGLF